MATAILLVPLIGAAGLAIDGARIQLVHARLSASLAAAALAGAQALADEASPFLRLRAERASQDLFWINFCGAVQPSAAVSCRSRTRGFLGAYVPAGEPRVVFLGPLEAPTGVTVSAEVRVPTTLTRILALATGDPIRYAVSVSASVSAAAVGQGEQPRHRTGMPVRHVEETTRIEDVVARKRHGRRDTRDLGGGEDQATGRTAPGQARLAARQPPGPQRGLLRCGTVAAGPGGAEGVAPHTPLMSDA